MNKNIIGKKFGMLTVLDKFRKDGKTYCQCKCDCGNKKTIIVRMDSLTSNRTQSCGCFKKSTQFKPKNIEGMRSGRLIAIKPTTKRAKNGSIIWECLCDCGNVVDVPETEISKNKVKSCGCLAKDTRSENISKASKEISKYYVESTSILHINNKTLFKSNKSGIKGVHWDRSKNKWVAQIGFRGKNILIGRYDSIQEAAKARKEAEDKYFKPVLEKYRGK